MRIGYFTSIEDWGGSESYLRALMLGVRAKGHEVVLFGVGGSRLLGEMTAVGVPCVAWKQRAATEPSHEARPTAPVAEGGASRGTRAALRALVPFWLKLLAGNWREMRQLAALFAANRVDLMHVSNSGYEVAGLACRRVGIPCLVMNMITPPDGEHWVRRWLMRYTARRYDLVSSQSASCTEAWRRYADVPAERCSFVWNSADLARFAPPDPRARRAADPFRLVSVGRLHPMKGHACAVAALRELAGDARFTLEILGEGPERPALEAAIREGGLIGRVRLAGDVDDVAGQLREADAFVLASVSHESCPAVLPEAMACGLPLVTSDFGPLPEINVAGETGLVVTARDAGALAGAFRTLADDPALARRYGAAARARAERFFGRERMVDETVRLYQSLRPTGTGAASCAYCARPVEQGA
jgi:glycosyltransferase involved in cell wall biosynthesis